MVSLVTSSLCWVEITTVCPHEIKNKNNNTNTNTDGHDANIAQSTTRTQLFSFSTNLQRALNALLPRDIRTFQISPAPPPTLTTKLHTLHLPSSTLTNTTTYTTTTYTTTTTHPWSAMFDASRKLYSYRLSLPPHAVTTNPVQRYTRVHIDAPVDTDYLARVLRLYEG